MSDAPEEPARAPRPPPWKALADRRLAEQAARRAELEARALARLELERRGQEQRYMTDPWGWIAECVVTEDPHRKKYHPFPSHGEVGAYLHLLTDAFQTELLLAVMKSRRLVVTWLFMALLTWAASFLRHEYIFIGSRKRGEHKNEGSRELIKRAGIILSHLRAGPRIRYEMHPDYVLFPDTESQIIAVAQGSDQLRQVAATRIFLDEFCFWPDAEETWAGLRPTVENKGQIIACSTAYPGFFWDFVNDRTDTIRVAGWEKPVVAAARETLRTGVQRWQNPGNGATVYRLHYLADPDKRSIEWKAKESLSMSRAAWNREMEIEGESFAGRPVFEDDYDASRMVRPAPLALDSRRSLLRAWDFGFTHPICLVGQLYEARQFRIYRGWLGAHTDLKPFARECLRKCVEIFGRDQRYLECGDVAGSRAKSTGPSDIELLASEFGLEVRAEKIPVKESIALVRQFMSSTWRRGEPLFLIEDNPDTEYLQRCLGGGYHYAVGKEVPAQDGYYEHGGDVVRYLVWHFHLEGTAYEAELDAASTREIPREVEFSEFDEW